MLARRIAWNTIAQTAGKAVSTAIGIITVGMMTRYLGQDGFGAYTSANAFLQVFSLFLDLGINVTFVAMLGELAGKLDKQEELSSATFSLRLLCSVATLAIALVLGWFSPYPLETRLAIIALSGSLVLPGLTTILTGIQQQRLTTHISAVGEVAGRLALLGGLYFAQRSDAGLVWIMLAISLGSLVQFSVNALWGIPLRYMKPQWNPTLWKHLLQRSWPVGVSVFLNIIYYKGDALILSLSRSSAEVGIYGAAYRVLEVLITLPFLFTGVMLPLFSQALQEQRHTDFSNLVSRSVEAMFALVAPMVVGAFLLGPSIMHLIAGEEFISAGTILKPLMVATAIIYINVVFAYAVVALNKQRSMLAPYAVVAFVTLISYLVLIPRYGMWAAALLTIASEIAIVIANFVVSTRHHPLSLNLRQLLATATSTVIMGIVLWFIRPFSLFFVIPISGLVYGGCLFALGGVPRSFLQSIKTRSQAA